MDASVAVRKSHGQLTAPSPQARCTQAKALASDPPAAETRCVIMMFPEAMIEPSPMPVKKNRTSARFQGAQPMKAIPAAQMQNPARKLARG